MSAKKLRKDSPREALRSRLGLPHPVKAPIAEFKTRIRGSSIFLRPRCIHYWVAGRDSGAIWLEKEDGAPTKLILLVSCKRNP